MRTSSERSPRGLLPMTKTSKYDCDDCRDCIYRRVFEEGIAWCAIMAAYCPVDGCEMGFNKNAINIHD